MKRKTDNFSKFFDKKKNSAIKEAFKQEKKAAKKERKVAIERHFEEKRQAKAERFGAGAADPNSIGAAGKPADGRKATSSDRGQPPPKRFNSGKAGKPEAAHGVVKTGQPLQKGAPRKPSKPPAGRPAPIADQRKPSAAPPQKHAPVQATAHSGKERNGVRPQKPGPHPATVRNAGTDPNLIPLNKYIAHGGICSRRDAAELIRQGKVLVNGQPVTEPGTRVSPSDQVKVNSKQVTMSRNFVYILLNKPKDYITTTDDPLGRKTVLDLIRQATPERVYPIGRLDRNTSGVLLLTNDGDLAQKLAHPSHEVKKIYHVTLDKVVNKADFDQIAQGVTLDDGLATVDAIAYADARDKSQIGLEIHSGRNRIVRRIFEKLGYDVRGLDRVMYAGLTKKNVQRGKWRLLTEKEIRILKYLNSSGRPAPKSASPGKTEPSGKPGRPGRQGKAGSPASPARRPYQAKEHPSPTAD